MQMFKEIIKLYKKEKLSEIAGNMSFKLMLSIFPFFLIALNVLSILELDFGEIASQMPDEIIVLLESLNFRGGLSIIALLVLLYNASKGFSAMINGINSLYWPDERKKSSIYGLSLLIFVLFIAALVFSIVFSGLGILIIFFTVLLINILAIKPRVKVKNLLPGCSFVTLAWAALSIGFNIYINNFSNMTVIYGSVAGIMMLLIWINLICNILLLGSVINIVVEKKPLT
ncbi:MAG: YihY/virulence factor BrkB family protein [Defluviitaleaceae bacterium]|nr:YihY/virulence factor BrkB family protein [Defluviitaleaceae bacterium]